MKVVGFSFIKDAVRMQYPIAEAIRSILPLCDEVVVAVGASTDGTRELVESLGPKVRIIDTVWDFSLKGNGKLLAVETDKALRAVPEDADWLIYIQGDEVLHESGFAAVKEAMTRWKDDPNVDGLLFKYRHFFGSYDYIGIEGQWYRHEIRVIKNDPTIYSYRDAQGFRKGDNQKLNVKPVDAYIHHYGWVQTPSVMKAKKDYKKKIYENGEYEDREEEVPESYSHSMVRALQRYTLPHPEVMKDRIQHSALRFHYDERNNRLMLKDHFKNFTEKFFGKRFFDYRNYRIV